MAANDKQIGGSHYKQEGTPQHWDVVTALNWDYLLGAATKYLWRLGRKGDEAKAIEDISKAIHYLEKKRELMQAELTKGKPEYTINAPGVACNPNSVVGTPVMKYPNPTIHQVPEHMTTYVSDHLGYATAGYVNQDR